MAQYTGTTADEERKTMIKAVIFDMDGVLIDSEPMWQEAEKIAFEQVGITLTTADCVETMGMRCDAVVQYRYNKQPWSGKSLQEMERDIVRELVRQIREKGDRMPGVTEALDFFAAQNIRLALASSSNFHIIETVLEKLGLQDTFEVVHSAEAEAYGKPHPAIYISTLAKLNLQPENVVAIEDSFNGLLAAKSARLKTICIPEQSAFNDTKYDIADLKLRSLTDLNEENWQALNRA